MEYNISSVQYYNITVEGKIIKASELLSTIAGFGIDFLAYNAVPINQNSTRFTLFPKNGDVFTTGAKNAGIKYDGPYSAVIVTADEQPGALAGIYLKLSQAGIEVEESSGIAHINNEYGVVLYLPQDSCEKAVKILS